MAIRKIPEKFKTLDGREYDSEAEAKRHEAVLIARSDYKDAMNRFGQLLAETQRTADGQLFQFGVFRDYYYVTLGYATMPHLVQVDFVGRNFDLDDKDNLLLVSEDRDHRRTYKISELYVSKRKAEEALLAARKAWLAERAAEIAEMEKSLSNS